MRTCNTIRVLFLLFTIIILQARSAVAEEFTGVVSTPISIEPDEGVESIRFTVTDAAGAERDF